MPRTSVLLPCYNAARFVPACIQSLLAQTARDLEIVAVDDGSTDGTAEILERFAQEDRRVRVIRSSPNKGLISALNLGIEACDSEFVARMDADDIALPHRVETQLDFLKAAPHVGVVSAKIRQFRDGGWVFRQPSFTCTTPPACAFMANFATVLSHTAAMLRRTVFEEFRYSTMSTAWHTEDYELWARLTRSGIQLANIPKILCHVRLQPTGVSHAFRELQASNFVTCVREHLELTGVGSLPMSVVRVLANRVDFSSPDIPLEAGLSVLRRLYLVAIGSYKRSPRILREIRRTWKAQETGILRGCIRRGRRTLQWRALHWYVRQPVRGDDLLA